MINRRYRCRLFHIAGNGGLQLTMRKIKNRIFEREENMPRQNVKRRRVQFEYQAPEAGSVSVAGDFNGWDQKKHAMKIDGNGVWRKTLMLPAGTYEYRFLVDGNWQNDPKNDRLRRNCFGSRNNLLQIIS